MSGSAALGSSMVLPIFGLITVGFAGRRDGGGACM